MVKTFNITRNDLKYLINESVRKILLLMESVEEGGKAGHMEHPYDADDFTFGDYKQLVIDLLRTGKERYTEKLDGMNIFATVSNDGTVRFARNSSDVKNPEGGMDPDGIAARWGRDGKDPTILAAYTNAYKLFGDMVNTLKDPVGFFNGDGYRIYVNCEVIDQTHPNVIPYPEKMLSFHGLEAFKTDGSGKEAELPDELFDQKMETLERLMPSVSSDYGKVQITNEVAVDIAGDNEETIQNFISQIDRIEEMAGVDDNTTIIQYREKLLPLWLQDHGYGEVLNNQFADYFIRRWVYNENKPAINIIGKQMSKIGIQNWERIYNLAVEFEGGRKADSPLRKAFSEIMHPVEIFFYRLGNDIISRCKGYTNTGRENIVHEVVTDLLNSVKTLVSQSDCLAAQREMTPALVKLAELDYKYNALEGVVFKYKGHTFKLTGSFAALNRAINSRFKLQNEKNQA